MIKLLRFCFPFVLILIESLDVAVFASSQPRDLRGGYTFLCPPAGSSRSWSPRGAVRTLSFMQRSQKWVFAARQRQLAMQMLPGLSLVPSHTSRMHATWHCVTHCAPAGCTHCSRPPSMPSIVSRLTGNTPGAGRTRIVTTGAYEKAPQRGAEKGHAMSFEPNFKQRLILKKGRAHMFVGRPFVCMFPFGLKQQSRFFRTRQNK